MLSAANYCVTALPEASPKRAFPSKPVSKCRQDYYNLRVGIFSAAGSLCAKSFCFFEWNQRGAESKKALVIGIPVKTVCMWAFHAKLGDWRWLEANVGTSALDTLSLGSFTCWWENSARITKKKKKKCVQGEKTNKQTNTKQAKQETHCQSWAIPTQNMAIIESSLTRKCNSFYRFRCPRYKKGSYHLLPGGI